MNKPPPPPNCSQQVQASSTPREMHRSVGRSTLGFSRLVRRHFHLTRRSWVYSRRIIFHTPKRPRLVTRILVCDRSSGEGSRELRQLWRARGAEGGVRAASRVTHARAPIRTVATRARGGLGIAPGLVSRPAWTARALAFVAWCVDRSRRCRDLGGGERGTRRERERHVDARRHRARARDGEPGERRAGD